MDSVQAAAAQVGSPEERPTGIELRYKTVEVAVVGGIKSPGSARQIKPTDWPYFGSIVKMLRPSQRLPALTSVWLPDWLRENEKAFALLELACEKPEMYLPYLSDKKPPILEVPPVAGMFRAAAIALNS